MTSNTTTASRRRRISLRTSAVAAVIAGASALSVSLSTPALADPLGSLVAVGSDTTQDVMNGIAQAITPGLLASYDAVDPATGLTRSNTLVVNGNTVVAAQIKGKPGTSPIPRPNGSGDGLNALRGARGTAASAGAPYNTGVTANSVDIARSSSGPGSATKGVNGTVQFIPFALDAVTYATQGNGTSNTSNIVDDFTKTQLSSLYNCTPVTVGTNFYDPTGTATVPAGDTMIPVDPYLPQAGSGTRKFWAAQMGISATAPPSCVKDTYNGGLPVEEHHGAVLAFDANGIAPFSIAQWIAQKNATALKINDYRSNAVLRSINGVAPLTGSTLNVGFPITREVYNVITRAQLSDAKTAALLVGSSSAVCGQNVKIQQYGFGLLTTSPLGHTCGQVADDLRDFDPANAGGTF